MILVGGTWFLGALIPGALLLHRGPLVQLHIAHPTGRLRRPLAVVTVVVAWFAAILEPLIANPRITLVVAALVTAATIDLHLHTHGPARKASLPGLRAAVLFAGVLALSSANQIFDWQADLAIALGYDALVVGLVLFLLIDLLRPAGPMRLSPISSVQSGPGPYPADWTMRSSAPSTIAAPRSPIEPLPELTSMVAEPPSGSIHWNWAG